MDHLHLKRRLKEGKLVTYVNKIDVSTDEIPNRNPAIVTRVYEDCSAELMVIFPGGTFHVKAAHGGPLERGTWHFND